jgi:hypothetical protein
MSDSKVPVPTVVFVLSSTRSGSTWLGYVLGSTPKSAFVGEFRRAWDPQLRRSCAWCRANGHERCDILSGIERCPPDRGYELVFSRTGKEILVDTSKQQTWAEQFLTPKSHFKTYLIHLIRDPRGWYASERRRHPASVNEMIGEWVTENLAIAGFLQASKAQSSTVFYDELALSPEPGFSQLCNELGCPFDPSALRYWERPHHAFAANGASSPVLRSLPYISRLPNFITGDDAFYAAYNRESFIDLRWKQQLGEQDELAIRSSPGVARFLERYSRKLAFDGLQKLSFNPN